MASGDEGIAPEDTDEVQAEEILESHCKEVNSVQVNVVEVIADVEATSLVDVASSVEVLDVDCSETKEADVDIKDSVNVSMDDDSGVEDTTSSVDVADVDCSEAEETGIEGRSGSREATDVGTVDA